MEIEYIPVEDLESILDRMKGYEIKNGDIFQNQNIKLKIIDRFGYKVWFKFKGKVHYASYQMTRSKTKYPYVARINFNGRCYIHKLKER